MIRGFLVFILLTPLLGALLSFQVMTKENPKTKRETMHTEAGAKKLLYKIDGPQSALIVHTGTGGLFGGMGHKLNIAAKELSGEIHFSLLDPSQSSLEIRVKADSLRVTDPISEKDKSEIESNMKEKVLGVENFPEISFKSSQVTVDSVQGNDYKVQIRGDLTLCGKTQPLTIPTRIRLKEKNLEAEGEFQIKQKDFGIKPFSAAGGTIKVKNELNITFRISAHP